MEAWRALNVNGTSAVIFPYRFFAREEADAPDILYSRTMHVEGRT
jgi:hypothetical protein